MAFSDYDAYLAALNQAIDASFMTTAGATPTFTRIGDVSRVFVPTPVAPTTSVALDKTSDRAINGLVPDAASGGRMSILGAQASMGGVGGAAMMLVDMLAISGGLSGIVTTPQTTNLPTAALTRYVDGAGVHAALVVYANVGGTATTVTCSYTNQAGTPGRTTTAAAIGGGGLNTAGTLIRLGLQDNDTGVQSVESVTLAGTTATAGSFGVVLFKPLAMVMVNDVEGATWADNVSSGRMVGQFAEVLNNACLSLFATMPVSQSMSGVVLLGEA
jgi:hypothetical protein